MFKVLSQQRGGIYRVCPHTSRSSLLSFWPLYPWGYKPHLSDTLMLSTVGIWSGLRVPTAVRVSKCPTGSSAFRHTFTGVQNQFRSPPSLPPRYTCPSLPSQDTLLTLAALLLICYGGSRRGKRVKMKSKKSRIKERVTKIQSMNEKVQE